MPMPTFFADLFGRGPTMADSCAAIISRRQFIHDLVVAWILIELERERQAASPTDAVDMRASFARATLHFGACHSAHGTWA